MSEHDQRVPPLAELIDQGFKTAKYECPSCWAEIDGATHVGTDIRQPEPGDLSVCFYCASLLVYTLDDIRLMAEDELENLPEDIRERLIAVKLAIKELREKGSDRH